MLDTVRQIDLETPAQGVEARRRSRKPHTRQAESVYKGTADWISMQASQFGIQKREIKLGVVNHQPVRPNKGQQLVCDDRKGRLVR